MEDDQRRKSKRMSRKTPYTTQNILRTQHSQIHTRDYSYTWTHPHNTSSAYTPYTHTLHTHGRHSTTTHTHHILTHKYTQHTPRIYLDTQSTNTDTTPRIHIRVHSLHTHTSPSCNNRGRPVLCVSVKDLVLEGRGWCSRLGFVRLG